MRWGVCDMPVRIWGIIVGANRIRPNIVFAQYNAFVPKNNGKINGIP